MDDESRNVIAAHISQEQSRPASEKPYTGGRNVAMIPQRGESSRGPSTDYEVQEHAVAGSSSEPVNGTGPTPSASLSTRESGVGTEEIENRSPSMDEDAQPSDMVCAQDDHTQDIVNTREIRPSEVPTLDSQDAAENTESTRSEQTNTPNPQAPSRSPSRSFDSTPEAFPSVSPPDREQSSQVAELSDSDRVTEPRRNSRNTRTLSTSGANVQTTSPGPLEELPIRNATIRPREVSYPEQPSPRRQSSNEGQSSSSRRNSLRLTQPPGDVILPRWQPDAEVTYCPICRTQFSFFVRKHHCRKCGRVVCSSCSPHRITIPYQFIVQPPSAIPAGIQPRPASLQRDTDTASIGVDSFGGTKVRLCNPCVPDPNVAPPQQQPSNETWREPPPTYYLDASGRPYSFNEEGMNTLERHTNSSSARARGLSAASGLTTDRRDQSLPTSPYPARSTSIASNNNNLNPYPGQGQSAYRGNRSSSYLPYSPLFNPGPSRTPGPRHQSHQSLSISSSGSPSNPQPHYRSLISTNPSNMDRPLPAIPRIREEDECPVCHRELPPRSLPNFETARANHITKCIDDQIAVHSRRPPARDSSNRRLLLSTSGPQGSQHANSEPSTSSNAITLSQAIAIPPSAPQAPPPPYPNTPEGRTAAREALHAAVVLGSQSLSQEPLRRTGMFPYRATEKDCVDDAECTICLEEFEVGVPMARLECLCRFHRKCIEQWFVGHPGRCPVHQHDGYGF